MMPNVQRRQQGMQDCGECRYVSQLKIYEDQAVDDQLNTPGYARATLPQALKLEKSQIRGIGVFSRCTIPRGVRFGPFKGQHLLSVDWEVFRNGNFMHYIDAADETCSNWMTCVNSARSEEEQNLCAFQLSGQVYYRAFKKIPPNRELLVWYGEEDWGDDVTTGATQDGSGDNEEETRQCTNCRRVFTCSRFLERHVKYRCSATRKHTLSCPLCEHKATNKKAATEHLKTHASSRPKQCPLCKSTFSKPSKLTRHLRSHTGETPYQCEHCEKTFGQSGNLSKHLRTHTGEKPFHCAHCDKVFNQSSNLKKHLRTHTGEKPFQCLHCNKTFGQSSHLSEHLRTHTGEKPYQCAHCDKAFVQTGNLTMHLRTHTGKKPFQCPRCDKAFIQSSNLTDHLRTHTGEKPFQCAHCDKAFNQASNLKKHLRTHR